MRFVVWAPPIKNPGYAYATNHVIAGPDVHRTEPLALWSFSQHLSAKNR